jgi:mannose-6-phosphate isomerase-like protein (cupin superfamily)
MRRSFEVTMNGLPILISTANAEHYNWGANCDGWFLLKSEDLYVIQERMPAGTAEAAHHHNKSRQLFYVLRGELTIRINESSIKIAAGQSLVIDPGTTHQARNKSSADVEFLVISCPPSHGDRINVSE